ncbi:hypothetical protein F4778DRAFT_52641 [Xylariomycetidae sp. FL2044]|nr:hypothetical protein F4778DRAFT_52641 [Xylariomycetidae sp. FL2044]
MSPHHPIPHPIRRPASASASASARLFLPPFQRTTVIPRTRRPYSTPAAATATATTISAAEAADRMNQAFAGRSTSTTQHFFLDGNQLQKLSLTLGRRSLLLHETSRGNSSSSSSRLDIAVRPPPTGTPVPPGYHLVYFTPGGLESELGPDGTDRTFNAPAPFTRRMWAGGRMEWYRESAGGLRVGDEVEEVTEFLGAVPKRSSRGQGGAGEMVLVDVVKRFYGPRGLAVVDQRSWIFRPEAQVTSSRVADQSLRDAVDLSGPSTVRDLTGDEGDGYPPRQFRWSPVGLFRFSALTFNGHKIHYDPAWSASVEGHPGVVVHGPLNLICMLDYFRDRTGIPIGGVSYKALSPLYAGDTYTIRSPGAGVSEGGTKCWDLLVEKGGTLCMKGSIWGQKD